MKKIYVGNLLFSATEDELRQLITEHGTVESINMITDRDTGQPRDFGFIEMAPADAGTVIQALNGSDLGGRSLNVDEARPRRDNGGSGNRPSW